MGESIDQNYEAEMFGSSLNETTPLPDPTDYEDGYQQQEINDNDNGSEYPEENTFMERYLRNRGIDKRNVQIENENGDVEVQDFDDLSDDDKLAVLEGAEESAITDEELSTINYLRENGINIQEYTDLIKQQAIKDYLSQNQSSYKTDDLSDDEIFILDLLDRFGDQMSNEEIDAELENAKQDEVIFQKKVDSIRAKYQQDEQEYLQQQALMEEANARKDIEEFTGNIIQSLNNLNEIQGVELEQEDRQQIADFLLTPDAANRTGFSKVLSDPDNLVKLAWFYLYGDQTFEATVDYFKNELSKSRHRNPIYKTVNKHSVNKRVNKGLDDYGLDNVFK